MGGIEMITVKMVRDKGFKFVEGDIIKGVVAGRVGLVFDIDAINNDFFGVSGQFEVEKIAWRESKGVIPCDGDLLIDIAVSGCEQKTTKAKLVEWDFWGSAKWRPSMKNWENEKMESEVKNLNLVVRLENFAQVDAINQIWRNSNIEPERSSCMDGFIGGVTSFPIIAYFDFELLEHDTSCGYDYAESSKYSQSAISFDEFLGIIANHEKFNKADSEPEWKCGDLCRIDGMEFDKIRFVGLSENPALAICECFSGLAVTVEMFLAVSLEKPETPEQREERESLELAYELYCAANNEVGNKLVSFSAFKDKGSINFKFWYAAAKRAKELLVK